MNRNKKIIIVFTVSIISLLGLYLWSWHRKKTIVKTIEWVEKNGGYAEYEYPDWSHGLPSSLRNFLGKELKKIRIHKRIDNVSPIQNAVHLEELYLGYIYLEDLSFLKPLTN
ncbi:MAG: hypothetical protein NE327_23235 [Lentisphaeraceae bacterium]|nr:hypothetical protein [Lentisphaeraceae bacterium]